MRVVGGGLFALTAENRIATLPTSHQNEAGARSSKEFEFQLTWAEGWLVNTPIRVIRGLEVRIATHDGRRNSPYRVSTPSPPLKIPAMQPVMSVANVAARRARRPRLARSSRREGARAAVPPTKIAIAATWAKPQSA